METELIISLLTDFDKNLATKENRIFDISFLLKSLGFFSKDVKQKVEQKQFILNDSPLTSEQLKYEILAYDEAGDFIFNNIDFFKRYKGF